MFTLSRLGERWEWSTQVTITRQGGFKRSSLDSLHEIEIFKGSENTLTMRQTYTYKFQCVFQLSRYPFDTQVKKKHFPNSVNCYRSAGSKWWSGRLT